MPDPVGWGGWEQDPPGQYPAAEEQITGEPYAVSWPKRPARAKAVLKPSLARPKTHLCSLVCEQGVLSGVLAIGTGLELRQIAVVVAFHLQIEHLGLARGGGGNEMVIQKLQDAGAYFAQFLLHLQTGLTVNTTCRLESQLQ